MEDDEFERLWVSLVERKHGKSGEPLCESEELLYALNFFAGSVPRSGMIGYFENSSGKEILAAKEALKILELDVVLKVLEDAQRVLMGERALVAVEEPIEVIPHDLDEEQYEKYSEDLEGRIAPVEEEFEAVEDVLNEGIDRFIEMRRIRRKDTDDGGED